MQLSRWQISATCVNIYCNFPTGGGGVKLFLVTSIIYNLTYILGQNTEQKYRKIITFTSIECRLVRADRNLNLAEATEI
mgnify:CR=1 FL=1